MKAMPTLVLLIVALAGCASTGAPKYAPAIGPGDFVDGVTNPFMPLKPGSRWVYEGQTANGTERTEVVVLNETRTIMGVKAVIVRDTVTVAGQLHEDTFDWYAQDRDGNVWYLGEDVKEYRNGAVVGAGGSWEWGVNGAKPGFAMKADPRPDGRAYYQEFLWNEAEDQAAVIAQGHRVETPNGTFSDTVTIREWTRLHANFEEEKEYARGIGMVAKATTRGGSPDREALVSFSPG